MSFKAAQAQIAKREGISAAKASASAQRKNPKLLKVSGVVKKTRTCPTCHGAGTVTDSDHDGD